MGTRLIRMDDGVLVQVVTEEGEPTQISAGEARSVDTRFDSILPTLKAVCAPIASAWQELEKSVSVDEVEIQLDLGFETGGTIFLASGKTQANLSVTLTLKPARPLD